MSFPEFVVEGEKVRSMALKSAYDDLRQTTVEKIPGTWGRLKYVAGLRGSTGSYDHWGFERTHGPGAAQEAFAKVHKRLVNTILQTRLSSLQEDLGQSSHADGASPTSYASTLNESLSRLLPSGCPKESQLHLISVLQTLAFLAVRPSAGSQSS